MKRRILLITVIVNILLLGLIAGCSRYSSKQQTMKKAEKILERQYKGDFIVYDAYYRGKELWVEAAWTDNPAHVFTVATNSGKETIKSYYYFEPYNANIARGIEGTIKQDMESLFPGAFYRVRIASIGFADYFDINNADSYEEILKYAKDTSWCVLDIFIDGERRTPQHYQEEYVFFTETVNEYIEENRMCRIAVEIHWLNEKTIGEIRDYLETSDMDSTFYDYLRGKPVMRANFDPTAPAFITSYEEYYKLREEIEK